MKTKLLLAIAMMGAATISVVAGGCHKSQSSAEVTMVDGDGSSRTVVSKAETPNRAGALLWSQNCSRCHNLRDPRERSDRGWDVISLHMRVRANLTAEEHRLILAFLKSAN
jgi:hypothetical protein